MGGTSYDAEMPTDIPDGFIVIRDRTHPGGYRAVDPATITGGGGGGGGGVREQAQAQATIALVPPSQSPIDWSVQAIYPADLTSMGIVGSDLVFKKAGLYIVSAQAFFPNPSPSGAGSFRSLYISEANSPSFGGGPQVAPIGDSAAPQATMLEYTNSYLLDGTMIPDPVSVFLQQDSAVTMNVNLNMMILYLG